MKITLQFKPDFGGIEPILNDLSFCATKLYNTYWWYAKQAWKHTGQIPSDYDLDPFLQKCHWYRKLHSQNAQATLKELWGSYKSWFKARKTDSTRNPPGPRNKKFLSPITWKKDGIKLLSNRRIRLSISKDKQNQYGIDYLYVSFRGPWRYRGEIQQVKFVHDNKWKLYFILDVKEPKLKTEGQYAANDLGVINASAIVTENKETYLYPGRHLLSLIQYHFKEIAQHQSEINSRKIKWSKHCQKLWVKRNNQVKDAVHKITNCIVKDLVELNVKKLFIGDLTNIRQSMNFGHKTNQKVHSFPIRKIRDQIIYKLRLQGIDTELRDERGSSHKWSLANKKTGYRKYRGLYVSKRGILNADINGANNQLNVALKRSKGSGALAAPVVRRPCSTKGVATTNSRLVFKEPGVELSRSAGISRL